MRAMLRTGPVLLAAALLVLAPTISPGGPPPPGHKGPFDIDPRTEKANEDFDLSVDRGDGDPCGVVLVSAPDGGQPTAVLFGDGPEVDVQVVDTEGNAGPPNTVLEDEAYTPDAGGDWGSGLTIPLNLPAGTYLVTAECSGAAVSPVNGAGSASAESSTSEPAFVLLGRVESPRCTEIEGEQREDPLDGCYVPQELVIEAEAAEPRVEDPAFTG